MIYLNFYNKKQDSKEDSFDTTKTQKEEKEMEEVRIGIIGIGNMGSSHAERIQRKEVKGLCLEAVADIREDRRKWAEKTLSGVRVYEDGKKLLDDPKLDAVLISVPHYDHPLFVIEALKHGLHVMCEKPAGVYTRQVREMNEEAAKHPELVYGLMFNQRTNPIYKKMKKLVESGQYGAIKRVNWIITDWYRSQAYYNSGGWRATWKGEGGGVLLNQCPHNLDLLQWICGMPCLVEAHCHEGKWHRIEVEDDVTAYLEYPNGATGVFITSTGDAPGTNRLEIDLEKGRLVSENGVLEIYELEINEREYCFQTTKSFEKPLGYRTTVEAGQGGNEHNRVLQAFTEAIQKGTPLIARGEEGIFGLTLSNAMHLSSWLKEPVYLPLDEERFFLELNKKIENSEKKGK